MPWVHHGQKVSDSADTIAYNIVAFFLSFFVFTIIVVLMRAWKYSLRLI